MSQQIESESADILLVEDNKGDIRLIQEGIRESRINHQLHIVNDGEKALQFLYNEPPYQEAPLPDLILLDLNLPRKGGREVLNVIKSCDKMRSIPVVVLTSSEADKDILNTYRLHANCYICKPLNFDHFVEVFQSIEDFWFNIVKLPPDG